MPLDPTSLTTILIIIGCALGLCILFAIPFVIILLRSKKQRQETLAAWAPLARSAGLQLEQQGAMKRPLLRGVYRGRPLTVSYGTHATSETKQIFTTIRLDTSIRDVRWLSVHKLGMAEKIAKKIMPGVVKTGDEFFDQQFIIMTNTPKEAAGRLLGGSLARRIIAGLSPGWFAVTVYNQGLSYEECGILKDAGRLRVLFEGLSDLADEFEKS